MFTNVYFWGRAMRGGLNQGLKFCAGVTVLAALAACGGGGGGDKQSASTPTATAEPASVEVRSGEKIRLGGIVSKGLLGNATVRVLTLKADGSIDDSAPLATGTTDYQGTADADRLGEGEYYTTEFAIPGIYVVEVTARSCSDAQLATTVSRTAPLCSYHVDEETGPQYLPTGFKIRAVVASTPTDNRVNVTLFSELAIRAAIKAAGGTASTPKLTADSVAKGQALVNNLFGTTDLNNVVPASLPTVSSTDTLTPAQGRLAAMLAAASKIAGQPARLAALLNGLSLAQTLSSCASVVAATPQATQCVLDVLANNANVNQYVGDNTAITVVLNNALQQVVVDTASAEIAAVTSTTSDKLTNDTLSVPAPASDVGAYTTIRNFFADLVSTARTLFTTTDGEATIKEARAFEAAGKNLKFTGQTLISDSTALEMAVELWHDYDLNPATAKVERLQHRDITTPSFVNSGHYCVLQTFDGTFYQDAVNGDTISRVVCFADYAYRYIFTTLTSPGGGGNYNVIKLSHGFVVSRTSATSYSYVSAAVKDLRNVTLNTSTGTVTSDGLVDRYFIQDASGSELQATNTPSIPASVKTYSGTLTATYDASNNLQQVVISGQVPDGIRDEDVTVVHASTVPNNGHAQLDVTVSGSTVGTTNTANFSGTQTTYAADGSTQEFLLDFQQGTVVVINEDGQRIKFNATLTAGTDKFVGSVDVNRIPKGSTGSDGATLQLTGAFYNLATSSTTPFVQASLTYKQDNTNYVETTPTNFSSSNFQLHTLAFDGIVTAPNSPKLRVALTGAAKQMERNFYFGLDAADAISGDYFIYTSSGGLKRDVTFTFKSVDGNASGTPQVSSEVVDPTNKVAFTFGHRANAADVLVNKVKRGVLDTAAGNLPKVSLDNGEFFSLDFGTIQY